MSQAMIRGVMDESGEQFVAYFLPLEETMEKRATDASMEREYDEEQEYEYKMARYEIATPFESPILSSRK